MTHSSYTTRRAFLIATAAVGGLILRGKPTVAQQAEQSADTILSVVPAPGAAQVYFSDADLAEMPAVTFETSTIWTEGIQEFSGPSLAGVLEAAGMSDSVREIQLTALNDYAVRMDMAQVESAAPIVANRINGAPFSVREKGPLWVVFPYDSAPRYRAESIFAVCVLQLRHIEAL